MWCGAWVYLTVIPLTMRELMQMPIADGGILFLWVFALILIYFSILLCFSSHLWFFSEDKRLVILSSMILWDNRILNSRALRRLTKDESWGTEDCVVQQEKVQRKQSVLQEEQVVCCPWNVISSQTRSSNLPFFTKSSPLLHENLCSFNFFLERKQRKESFFRNEINYTRALRKL